jgi:hypothetical protein
VTAGQFTYFDWLQALLIDGTWSQRTLPAVDEQKRKALAYALQRQFYDQAPLKTRIT